MMREEEVFHVQMEVGRHLILAGEVAVAEVARVGDMALT